MSLEEFLPRLEIFSARVNQESNQQEDSADLPLVSFYPKGGRRGLARDCPSCQDHAGSALFHQMGFPSSPAWKARQGTLLSGNKMRVQFWIVAVCTRLGKKKQDECSGSTWFFWHVELPSGGSDLSGDWLLTWAIEKKPDLLPGPVWPLALHPGAARPFSRTQRSGSKKCPVLSRESNSLIWHWSCKERPLDPPRQGPRKKKHECENENPSRLDCGAGLGVEPSSFGQGGQTKGQSERFDHHHGAQHQRPEGSQYHPGSSATVQPGHHERSTGRTDSQ